MYFSSIYNTISEKIKGDKISEEIFNKLLKENKVYTHQLENMNILSTSKKLMKNIKDVKEVVLKLLTKNQEFIKATSLTNRDVLKENKKLLDFYNLNPKDLKASDLDFAIDLSTNKQNNKLLIENFLGRDIKKSFLLEKKILKENLDDLKYLFTSIKSENNQDKFKNQAGIVSLLAEGINNKNKTFIKESLNKIKEEKDMSKSIEKLYDLRILTEKVLKEFQKDDDEDKTPRLSGKKEITLVDLKHIKKVKIIAPYNWKNPDKIELKFIVPFYPAGQYRNDILEDALKIKKKLDGLQRTFINLFIYQKDRKIYFDPSDSYWQVIMRTNGIKEGTPVFAKFEIYLNVSKLQDNDWETLYKQGYSMLKDFDRFLPIMFEDSLTDKFQKIFTKQKAKQPIGTRTRRPRSTNSIIPKQKQTGDDDSYYDMWVGKNPTPTKMYDKNEE